MPLTKRCKSSGPPGNEHEGLKLQVHIDTEQVLKSLGILWCSKESNQKPKLVIVSTDFVKERKKLSCLRLLEKKSSK